MYKRHLQDIPTVSKSVCRLNKLDECYQKLDEGILLPINIAFLLTFLVFATCTQ